MVLTFITFMFIYLCGSSANVTENVYGWKGSSYTFICPHRKTSTHNVVWQFIKKSGSSFGISDGTFLASVYPARDRVEIVGNHSIGEYNIKLSDLQEADEGTYRCIVFAETKSYFFELLVGPSALVLYDVVDNKILGTEGMNVTINCTAIGGNPPPDLKLEIDSQVFNDTQTVQYTIPVLKRSHDKQLVKCQATSKGLNFPFEQTATLYLYLKPSTPVFNRNSLIVNETQQLIVSCTSTGSRPAGLIYWKLKSNVLSSGIIQQNTSDSSTDTYTSISTLQISVDRSYNGQPITCGVTHQALSQALETTKAIYVNYAPTVTVSDVTYNQTDNIRTVTCNPIGYPATFTYYRWQHKSKYGMTVRELVGRQDGILTLPDLSESDRFQDTGEYVCIVGNGFGDKNGNLQQKGYGFVTINVAAPTPKNRSLYYRRRKLFDKRDHSAYKEPKCATSYDEVVTSIDRNNKRQEDIIPEIQLEQYETLGPKEGPTVYEQLDTNNS